MTRTRAVFKSGVKLGATEIVAQAGSFARNVIIARLISPEDFGISVTLGLMLSFLEMMSNLAAERLLVQSADGDDPTFQASTHVIHACRGLVNALLAFILAGFVSQLFGVPSAKWAYQTLALVPLIRGFTHTDLFRFQRTLNFNPSIIVNASTSVLITLIALPLGLWSRSYAVMVGVLLVEVICSTIGSHVAAERSYRWAWNWHYVRQIIAFGWPLLINGFLVFVIFQGDRLIIAVSDRVFAQASYTHTELAAYSLAFSLTLMPTLLVSNVSLSLLLPLMSRVQSRSIQFQHFYRMNAQILCLVAVAISVPLILAGHWLVSQIYGAGYAPAPHVIPWLAAMQMLRIIRVAPTLAAMALGDTKNSMVANSARTVALVGVLGAASAGQPLEWIAAAGFAGEFLALVVCVYRLRAVHGIPLRLCLEPSAVAIIGTVTAAAVQHTGVGDYGWKSAFFSSGLLIGAVSSLMLFAFPRLRQNLRSLFVG